MVRTISTIEASRLSVPSWEIDVYKRQAQIFEAAGLVVEEQRRLDHALAPYAHYLIRLRRPDEPSGENKLAQTVDDPA